MPRISRPVRPRSGPALVVLCGPSHAGKSTFAARHLAGAVVISSDAIRSRLGGGPARPGGEPELWRRFEAAKRRALLSGRDVVLDACHLSARARRHAVSGPTGGHFKVCVVFDVPLVTALARCLAGGRVAPGEVRRMWRAFQTGRPTTDELFALGFDYVGHVTPAGTGWVASGRVGSGVDPPSRTGDPQRTLAPSRSYASHRAEPLRRDPPQVRASLHGCCGADPPRHRRPGLTHSAFRPASRNADGSPGPRCEPEVIDHEQPVSA